MPPTAKHNPSRRRVAQRIGNEVLDHPAQQAPIRMHREAAAMHTKLQIARSEAHTSELQSLMRISYAVFCLKKKTNTTIKTTKHTTIIQKQRRKQTQTNK